MTKRTIGWVDDDQSQLESSVTRLEAALDDVWEVTPTHPLQSLHDYIEWIVDNDIAALLVDERLSTLHPSCTYDGHNLIDYVHRELPLLPLFFVTGHAEDENVVNAESQVFQIVSKKPGAFSPVVAARIAQAASLYANMSNAVDERLSEIADKAAEGVASEAELAEGERISMQVWGHAPLGDIQNRSGWILEGEALADQFAKLLTKLEGLVGKDGSG